MYDRYKGQVYRAVVAITSDSAAAEDILQECFLRLHANIDRSTVRRRSRRGCIGWRSTWLITTCLATSGRASPLSVVLETLVAGVGGSPDRHAELHETNDVVQAAIARLSLSHRLVVILFYLGDFSLEEIAYILDYR